MLNPKAMQKRYQGWAECVLKKLFEEGKSMVQAQTSCLLPQGLWKGEVCVVGRRKMEQLCARFFPAKRVTDVLSFPASAFFWKQGFLGELVIFTQQVRSQAKKYRISEKQALTILCVHGFLHLLGWDHERSFQEGQKMKGLENQLLKTVFHFKEEGLIQKKTVFKKKKRTKK